MLINLRNALMAGERLPYDAEVEYLESSRTQYIDTGVKKTSGTTIDCTFSLASTNTKAVFGARTGAVNSDRLALFAFNSNFRFDAGGQRYLYTPNTTSTFRFQYDGTNAVLTNLTTGVVDTQAVSIGEAGTVNIVLFGVSTNGNISAPLEGRIYSFKLWQSGVLALDFIPVRKGAVGYLYDRVSGKLFGNQGTGDFVLGQDVVPVEWLYNSGLTQYIDTGYTPTTYTETSLGFEIVSQSSSTAIFGGTDIPNNFYAGYVILRHDTTQGADDYNFRVNHNDAINATLAAGTHDVVMNEHGTRALKVDGTTVGTFSGTLSVSLPIFAFCRNSNGSAQTQYSMPIKLRYLKIKDDSGATVRSMLSVRVGTEGAMMDVLTRRIYRNAGTGAFTYGNDLKYPIPAE